MTECPRKQWTRKSAAVRREEIVSAAAALITQQGMNNVSLQQVANRAGLSKASIYVHFESKESLFREVTRASLALPMERAQSALKREGTLEARATEMLRCKLGRFYETMSRSEYGSEIIDSVNRIAMDLIATDRRIYVGLFRRLIEEGVETREFDLAPHDTTPRDLAEMIVAAAHGLARNGEEFVSQRILVRRCRLFIHTLFSGLRTRSRTRGDEDARGAF